MQPIQPCYSVALYLRLSRDDGPGESGSIKTQQMMLERYCREQNLAVYDIYIDDGYSGLNFDRPSFRRMLRDIENGHVNLVITKDLSRLGRDYIRTGHYTELFFPQHGVRYIALNDGVDTLRDDNDIAPFKNILNDLYAKDLSRKVKTAKRARAAQGAFTGSHAPYGYRKSADSCNVLEIDDETAPIVRRIFALSLGGIGAVEIARLFAAEHILTPSAYKARRGETHFVHLYRGAPDERQYRWAYTTVRRILTDRVYLGHMTGHKSQVEHYKTKKRSPVPQAEQIVVENTHPALICREDFDKVQMLVQTRRSPQHSKTENPFRALLYCGECGHRLSMATKVYKGERTRYYRCMHHYHFPGECTGTHYIRFDDVYEIVRADFRCIADLLSRRMDRLVSDLSDSDGEHGERQVVQSAKLQQRLDTIDAIIGQMYEDVAAKRTDAQTYHRLLARYRQEQEDIHVKLVALSNPDADKRGQLSHAEQIRRTICEQLESDLPESPLLNELIGKIHVGQREKIGCQWVQNIRIGYRFSDIIPNV